MKKWISILMVLQTIQGVSQLPNRMVYLKNDQVEIGILKDVGGRIVFFGSPNGGNFLYSDTLLWNESVDRRVVPTPQSNFKPYNGFITWVGPQSQWWNQQTVNSIKKDAVWPPDPFLEYGSFEIENETASSITITSEISEITGLKFKKTFTIEGNKLLINVTATNCRQTVVSWDLWSNLRFDAFTKFHIPASQTGLIKIQKADNQKTGFIEHKFENGSFTFLPRPSDGRQLISKVFLYPDEGVFYVQKDFGKMVVTFDLVDRKLIHPEQGMVEVYNCITPTGATNILELEHHSAYKTLQPGESMEMNETWEILK